MARKIEQGVCGVGANFHGCENFDLGETAGRTGGGGGEVKKHVQEDLGNSGLQNNIKKMLGM